MDFTWNWTICRVLQKRNSIQQKKSIKNEGEIKTFSDEGKLTRNVVRKPAQKESQKEVHQREGKLQSIKNEGRATEMVNIWVNISDDSPTQSFKCIW